jgi:hypothetical protein
VVDGDTATYFIRVAGTLDSTTDFAGALRIGGLPLPSGAASVRDGSGPVGFTTNINAASAVVFASAAPYVGLYTLGASGSAAVDIPGQTLRGKVVDLVVTVRVTFIRA